MANYFASEMGLTKATKQMLAQGLPKFEYQKRDFDPNPYVKQDNSPVKRYVKKCMPKVTKAALEDFQQNRLFAIVRGNGCCQK